MTDNQRLGACIMKNNCKRYSICTLPNQIEILEVIYEKENQKICGSERFPPDCCKVQED